MTTAGVVNRVLQWVQETEWYERQRTRTCECSIEAGGRSCRVVTNVKHMIAAALEL